MRRPNEPQRVLAIASGGGHWIQLQRLRPAFSEFDVAFVSVYRDYADDVSGEAFSIFAGHVKQRYGAEPGFITMKVPRLLDVLDEVRVERPIVCANINKIGLRMSGGFPAYDRALRERRFRLSRCLSSHPAPSHRGKRSSGSASSRT